MLGLEIGTPLYAMTDGKKISREMSKKSIYVHFFRRYHDVSRGKAAVQQSSRKTLFDDWNP